MLPSEEGTRDAPADRPITVLAADPSLEPRAQGLAEAVGGQVVKDPALIPPEARFALVVTSGRIELRELGTPRTRPLAVDLIGGQTGFRRPAAGGKKQPIARAIGIRGQTPTVLDATAGLCGDAFLLATLGCPVTAVERSPILAALVEDGLRRAAEFVPSRPTIPARADDRSLAAVVGRMRLVRGDAREILASIRDGDGRFPDMGRPDVVYLDPMYPPSGGTAEVRREMRVLRALVGDDPDAAELCRLAQEVARRRVVVKRLRRAPTLAGKPSHTVMGTRVRYDVYLSKPGGPGADAGPGTADDR